MQKKSSINFGSSKWKGYSPLYPLKKYQFINAVAFGDKRLRKDKSCEDGSGKCSKTSKQTKVSNPVKSAFENASESEKNNKISSDLENMILKELRKKN